MLAQRLFDFRFRRGAGDHRQRLLSMASGVF